MTLIQRCKPLLAAISSAILTGCAFYIPHAWFLVFVALVPLIHAARTASTKKAALLWGLVTGVGIMGIATYAMLSVRSLPATVGLAASANDTAVFVTWFLILLVTAPLIGMWAMFVQKYDATRLFIGAVAACMWVALEYIRMYTFNFMTAAPHIANPPFFSFGFLGYPMAESLSWIQLAAMGGVALMSLVAIGANLAFYSMWQKGKLPQAIGLAVLLVLITVAPIDTTRERLLPVPPTPKTSVGIVSIYTAHGEDTEEAREVRAKQVQKAVTDLSQQGAKIILLPEVEPFSKASSTVVRSLPENTEQVVVEEDMEGVYGKDALAWGFATTLSGETRSAIRSKMILTPQGEYLIGVFDTALHLLGKDDVAEHFGDAYGLSTGDLGDPLVFKNVRASLLFCVEAFAPGLGKKLATVQDANLLLVMISHGRFNSSPLLETDTFRMSRVRAVEASRAMAVSAKDAPAFAFDAYGRVLAEIGQGGVSETAAVQF